MAPGNKRVLRRLRFNPPPKTHFTPSGAQQALDNAVAKIDEANPGNQWKLVSLGRWRFKLVWA
jgi:hypothetical protein